ncbi:MAG: tRNA-(ms[2]io[6]A)-hydroxylase [Myxococcota bacterium]
MFDLKVPTDRRWLDAVLSDFDAFLIDHAACERKASATGMSFVVRYADHRAMLDPLIAFAREELEHFHQVFRLCAARGLTLAADEKDPYVGALVSQVRTGRETRLLDRLLVAGVIEARGCESFEMLTEALRDPQLKAFYLDLTRAEARHHGLFLRLARLYFDEATVAARVTQLLDIEAEIIRELPLRATLH